MRSTLFRTDPVTVGAAATNVEIFKKDMTGCSPFTLYQENTDVQATLNTNVEGTTVNGSPATRVLWRAVAGGAAGNSKRIQILRDTANKVGLAVVVNVNDITYTIGELITAARLVDFVIAQSNPGGVTAELAVPASGGYGQAPLLAALTNLAGGVDSTVLGAASTTETSDNIGGPWTAVAGTPAFPATQAADSVSHSVYTQPLKFFRLLANGGAAATRVVAEAVRQSIPA